MKSGYPEIHYGGFTAEAEWEELLSAGRYGEHPPWHASAETYEAHKGKAALIPWLLFNRNLWLAQAEDLPGGVEDLNVLVPHAASSSEHSQGWYVRLKVSEDVEILGLEAVAMDDESAPSSEGFHVLPPGALPPSVAAPARVRRMRRMITSAMLLALSGVLAVFAGFLFGVSNEEELRHAAMQSDLRALRTQETTLQAEWTAKQELGLSSQRAAQLLMDALWFDAQVELQGQDVRWLGNEGQPLGLACDPPETDGNNAGWRNCRWEDA